MNTKVVLSIKKGFGLTPPWKQICSSGPETHNLSTILKNLQTLYNVVFYCEPVISILSA